MAASDQLKRSILKHLWLHGPSLASDIDKALHQYKTNRVAPTLGSMRRPYIGLVSQQSDKRWKLSAKGQTLGQQYAIEDQQASVEPQYKWKIMSVTIAHGFGVENEIELGPEWEPFAGSDGKVFFRQLVEV